MSSHKFRPSENVLSEYSATSVDPQLTETWTKTQPKTLPKTLPETLADQQIDLFDPFRISRRFDRMMSIFDRSLFDNNNFNIHEDETSYTYEIEMPGIPKEEIIVEEKDGYVSVSGKKSLKKEDKKEGYHYIGTSYGSFHRSFKVPRNGDVNQITAKYDSGVLSLVVPKIAGVSQKRITVM
jgi:HSP20 family molecular chaperone IbpA